MAEGSVSGEVQQRPRTRGLTFSLHDFHNFLKNQYRLTRLFRDLWVYLLLLIPTMVYHRYSIDDSKTYFIGACTYGAVANDELPPVNMQEGPTEGPSFFDTDGPEKWELWFESVLLPKLYDADNPSQSYPMGWPGIAGNNLLVGALRVRQQRARPVECPIPLAGVQCYSNGGRSGSLATRFDPAEDDVGPIVYERCDGWMNATYGGIHTVSKTYGCSGNVYSIPANATFDEAVNVLHNVLIPNGITDFAAARFLVVEYITYNLPEDVFVYNAHWVQVSIAGKLTPQGRPLPFKIEGGGFLAFYIVMTIIVTVLGFLEGKHWIGRYGQVGGVLQLLYYQVSNFWPVVRAAGLVSYLVQLGYEFQLYQYGTSLAHPVISPTTSQEFPHDLLILSGIYDTTRLMRAITMLLVFLRVLEFGSLIPPVYMVTSAISKASRTIIGACILCLTALLAFAVSGYIVFGSRARGFHNVRGAMDSMSRMLVGDYDLAELEAHGVVLANLFFWAYLITCCFILLNFITAIISHAIEDLDTEENDAGVMLEVRSLFEYCKIHWTGRARTERALEFQPPAQALSTSAEGGFDESAARIRYVDSYNKWYASYAPSTCPRWTDFVGSIFVLFVSTYIKRVAFAAVIDEVQKQQSTVLDSKSAYEMVEYDDQLALYRDVGVTYKRMLRLMQVHGAGSEMEDGPDFWFNFLWWKFLHTRASMGATGSEGVGSQMEMGLATILSKKLTS